jgi:hypothetical protein
VGKGLKRKGLLWLLASPGPQALGPGKVRVEVAGGCEG